MFTQTEHIEISLTPKQALLADHIGNEVYASHYGERKAYRLIIGCGSVLLLGSMGLNLSLAHRPAVDRYIRIDEMGRAQAIQYSDLDRALAMLAQLFHYRKLAYHGAFFNARTGQMSALPVDPELWRKLRKRTKNTCRYK